MNVTLLGTASPVPTVDRAGNAIALEVRDEVYLIDCGPRTVYELLRNEIDPGSIERLFITHNHMDHNLSFYHLAFIGWTAGRDSLTVYGPSGTDALIESLYTVWDEDIEYRKQVGYPPEGIENITWQAVDDEFTLTRDRVRVSALSVDHSIETYGFKFEDSVTSGTVVFSSDTAKVDRLTEFAVGADLLVMSCGVSPVGEPPDEGFIWERYTEPYGGEMREKLMRNHVTPEQAGEIAAEAGVERLVLTHLPPYPDTERIVSKAGRMFEGNVIPAMDGTSFQVPPQ